MTVTGATTAILATTSYAPPFKYVTSNEPAPLVTGTVTKPVSNNPTVAPGTSDIDYTWAYLNAHMMSWPSYRYIYLLWFLIIVFTIIYSLFHHLRFGKGSFGAAYSRWSIRRKPFGRKKGGTRRGALPSNGVIIVMTLLFVITGVLALVGADYINPSSAILNFGTSFRKRIPVYTISKQFWTSGSRFGDISFALIPLVVILAVKSPPFAVLAWRWTAQLYADKLALLHRMTAWTVWIATTAHVALWTIQLFEDKRNGKAVWMVMWLNYRFICGCVAYAALTAVMAFSLKPIRKNRYEFFYISHVVLVFVTLAAAAVHHPVLWFWMAGAGAIWAGDRIFRYARLARINGFLGKTPRVNTIAGRPYHSNSYSSNEKEKSQELYGMSELGHDGKERTSQYNMDKTLPRAPIRDAPTPGTWTPAYSPEASRVDLRDDFGTSSNKNLGYYDEGSFQPIGSYETRYNDYTTGQSYPRDNYGRIDPYANQSDQYVQDDIYQRHDPYATPSTSTFVNNPSENNSGKGYHPIDKYDQDEPSRHRDDERAQEFTTAAFSYHPQNDNIPALMSVPIPIGHAQAQLLPSRTIRLTIRTARPISWSPGQSVLLFLPDISKIQSHPFTIINSSLGPSPEIVLLVKARKGITRRLFDLVKEKSLASVNTSSPNPNTDNRQSQHSKSGSISNADVPPVYIRTWIDGPMGSAARVRWKEYSSILVICGGSGVSFGMAVCEYVVKCMARQRDRVGGNWKTQRVRFVWVAREYAEIAWVAHQLRKCQEIVPPNQLQVEIFVTNATKVDTVGLAPPQPGFARGFGAHNRSDSMDSIVSQLSATSDDGRGGFTMGGTNSPGHEDPEGDLSADHSYADIIDLTNYEDEEDINDPAEHQLSNQLQSQGKIRRAKSRKAAKSRSGGVAGKGMGKSSSGLRIDPNARSPSKQNIANAAAYPPIRSGLSNSWYDNNDEDPESAYALAAAGQHRAPTPGEYSAESSRRGSYSLPYDSERPHPQQQPQHPLAISSSKAEKRTSYRSLADSTYNRYDPFNYPPGSGGGPRGPSPSPSMFFDNNNNDNQSIAGESMRNLIAARGSRTGSMVLLDDPGATAYNAAAGIPGKHGRGGSGGRSRKISGGSSVGIPSNQVGGGSTALWIDMGDYESMKVMSEFAKAGKPKLAQILAEEVELAKGSVMVATCGPTTLNTVVRNVVSKQINPGRIRHGDKRGHIAIYSEDYES